MPKVLTFYLIICICYEEVRLLVLMEIKEEGSACLEQSQYGYNKWKSMHL